MTKRPQNLIVYKITYLPWVDNKLGKPWLYIGSTSRNLNRYFGSVSSKEYKDFWQKEVKWHPEYFSKEIIATCITNDRIELLKLEEIIQRDYDVVKSKTYFNKSYATHDGMFGRCVEGEANPMFGVKRSEEWKIKHKVIMQEISDRPEIKVARSVSQSEIQNRPEVLELKSAYQKKRWKSNNAGIQRNKDAWCPTNKVIFSDFTFLSMRNFEKYLTENKLSKILIRVKDYAIEYVNLKLSDLDIIQKCINLIGLTTKSYDIFIVKNVLETYKSCTNRRDISKLLNLSYHIITRIIIKYESNLDYINNLISTIKYRNINFQLLQKEIS